MSSPPAGSDDNRGPAATGSRSLAEVVGAARAELKLALLEHDPSADVDAASRWARRCVSGLVYQAVKRARQPTHSSGLSLSGVQSAPPDAHASPLAANHPTVRHWRAALAQAVKAQPPDGYQLGALFEGSVERRRRRSEGVYYTPRPIAQAIVERALTAAWAAMRWRLELPGDSAQAAQPELGTASRRRREALAAYLRFLDRLRVLDPACGSGALLCTAAHALARERQAALRALTAAALAGSSSGGPPAPRPAPWAAGLWGMDIDADALAVASQALGIEAPGPTALAGPGAATLCLGDSLLTSPEAAARRATGADPLSAVVGPAQPGAGFDVVVANPPYGRVPANSPARQTPAGEAVGRGLLNSAALFLLRGLELLRPGGMLSFILPRSFLAVRSWEPVRRRLLEQAELRVVDDVGRAFAGVGLEQVIILARRRRQPRAGTVRLLRRGELMRVASQAELRRRGTILSSLDPAGHAALVLMERAPGRLRDVARMPRGLSLPANAYHPDATPERTQVLGGTNVRPFHLGPGNRRKPNRYLERSHPRLLAHQELFARERLVYQNIMSSSPRLVAALERSGRPTDDTLNNLYLLSPGWTCAALGTLLQTTPYEFFLRFGLVNDATLTVHLDMPYVGALPLPELSPSLLAVLERAHAERQHARGELERLDAAFGFALAERLGADGLNSTRRAWHTLSPARLASTLRRLAGPQQKATLGTAAELLDAHVRRCEALLLEDERARSHADWAAAAALGLRLPHMASVAQHLARRAG